MDYYISKAKSCYSNLICKLKYSDTELLALSMNVILIIVNPLVFYHTVVNCPTWLVLIGIPFGLLSTYQILIDSKKGIDMGNTLIIGQLLGIIINIFNKKSLLFAFLFQLFIFSFLKWRSEKDLRRKRSGSRSCN